MNVKLFFQHSTLGPERSETDWVIAFEFVCKVNMHFSFRKFLIKYEFVENTELGGNVEIPDDV